MTGAAGTRLHPLTAHRALPRYPACHSSRWATRLCRGPTRMHMHMHMPMHLSTSASASASASASVSTGTDMFVILPMDMGRQLVTLLSCGRFKSSDTTAPSHRPQVPSPPYLLGTPWLTLRKRGQWDRSGLSMGPLNLFVLGRIEQVLDVSHNHNCWSKFNILNILVSSLCHPPHRKRDTETKKAQALKIEGKHLAEIRCVRLQATGIWY